jgi:hypothetical protein
MSSPHTQDFQAYSKEIARNFLQTVVVVDDLAYFEKCEEELPSELITPEHPSFRSGRREEGFGVDENDVIVSTTTGDTLAKDNVAGELKSTDPIDEAHELNAKGLIDSFAAVGILCAVIRPEEYEVKTLGDKVYPLAKRSDVLVFDWVLEKDDLTGIQVKKMISRIMQESSEGDNRLRLIVIYTGQTTLHDIVEQLERDLSDEGRRHFDKKDDFTLTWGPVRISVYAKGHVKGVQAISELAARKVEVEDLPEKLIEEFSDMTMGLVSNVALQSLAGLRDNTHRILSKFHRGMDAPFLAHRAMLEQPDDSINLLVYLVGAEMTAILEAHEVGKTADKDIIRMWLRFRNSKEKCLAENFSVEDTEEFLSNLQLLLQDGFSAKALMGELKNLLGDEPHKADLTAKLCTEEDNPQLLEYKFAVLTTLKSTYSHKEPVLSLGTILKEVADSHEAGAQRYWICIQPLCDSVRIRSKRAFPFLKLTKNDSQFDLVVPESEDSYVKVRICYRPHESKLIEFTADDTRSVRGVLENNKFIFTDKGQKKYEWVAELKFEHAQRIVNKYANEQSRVGLDESEWLRRSALKSGQ